MLPRNILSSFTPLKGTVKATYALVPEVDNGMNQTFLMLITFLKLKYFEPPFHF
jgi:hypothetical protein